MIDLKGKRALLAGVNDDVLKGVAARLHAAGAETVTVTARDIDFRRQGPLADAFATMDDIHIVVINPAWFQVRAFMDSTPDEWDSALEQNIEQAVYIAQAAARKMIAQGFGGRIIYLSHIATRLPLAYTSVAATTLAAFYPIVKMAAVDLGPYRITVNALAQGWMETEQTAPYLTEGGRDEIRAEIPLGRVGLPSDVGDVCCFLASDMAQYITGTVIPVDGGYTLTRSPGTSPFPDAD